MHQIILKDHLDSCHGWCFVKTTIFFQIEYCHQILVKGLRNVDFDSVESYEYGNFFFCQNNGIFPNGIYNGNRLFCKIGNFTGKQRGPKKLTLIETYIMYIYSICMCVCITNALWI